MFRTLIAVLIMFAMSFTAFAQDSTAHNDGSPFSIGGYFSAGMPQGDFDDVVHWSWSGKGDLRYDVNETWSAYLSGGFSQFTDETLGREELGDSVQSSAHLLPFNLGVLYNVTDWLYVGVEGGLGMYTFELKDTETGQTLSADNNEFIWAPVLGVTFPGLSGFDIDLSTRWDTQPNDFRAWWWQIGIRR